MPRKLGVLAGGGPLPGQLVASCRGTGREIFVVAFEGATDPNPIADVPHAWVRLGAVGRTIRLLRKAGVEEVVLAGPVAHPSVVSLTPDARALKLLAKLGKGALGDDRILSLIVAELEGEGFHVVGVDDILVRLLVAPGPLGKLAPDEDAEVDITLGTRIAQALGALDLGQAVVVQKGVVLGVEAVEGTDALLARCGGLRRKGPGGVLVKIKKPGQERRADLPTIGPRTVSACAQAGLRGVAVEAGGTLVLDRTAVVEAADRSGLFVVGIAVPRPD